MPAPGGFLTADRGRGRRDRVRDPRLRRSVSRRGLAGPAAASAPRVLQPSLDVRQPLAGLGGVTLPHGHVSLPLARLSAPCLRLALPLLLPGLALADPGLPRADLRVLL